MHQKLTAAHLAESLKGLATREIVTEMAALIRSGAIPMGVQLPPVRELAQELGVSPATVSAAWSELKRSKVIAGRGRNGIWVCGNKPSPRPVRFESVGNFGKLIVTDLTYASPDPALLPDMRQALLEGLKTPELNSYQRSPITPSLRDAVQVRWPYPAEAFMATSGGFDGVMLTLQALLLPGATVAIEDPTTARLLDILDRVGVNVIPVSCDEDGPIPASLAAVLRQKPAAFIYQPRTHSVCGHSVTASRLQALAEELAHSEVMIIEDDGIGDIAAQPAISLGNYYPERVVHIVSYSKSLGPDLRLAVLSGAAEVVGRIQSVRNFSSGWISRILQDAAAWMLGDSACQAAILQARLQYHLRRQALVAALQARGVSVFGRDGLSVWIKVPSEQFAVVTLAVRGFAVFPGSRFGIQPTSHIRVGTSQLDGNIESLADAIALCMQAV